MINNLKDVAVFWNNDEESKITLVVNYHSLNQKNLYRKLYTRKTGELNEYCFFYYKTILYKFKRDLLVDDMSGRYKIPNYQIFATTEKETKELEIPIKKKLIEEVKDGTVKHKEFETIKQCVHNDIPVYLFGPAGSGKNYTLRQIAEELKLDFYFTNAVQQEFKITGFIDAGGKYHETEFYKAFKNGGIFFLDEMDASIPEVLVLLNSAIANKYFEFPTGKIDAHKDFRVVSAGNTIGNGADEQYTGRLVLDQATLDRFVLIEFDYDINIELALAKGNKELVTFVRELRGKSSLLGIRLTLSYRCIISIQKLEKVLPLKKVIEITVLKGVDKDTARTLIKVKQVTKYSKALEQLVI